MQKGTGVEIVNYPDNSLVKMELTGVLSEYQIDVLTYLYLVLLPLSLIGSFSVLVVSAVRWKQLKEQVHLLVQLALADLLAALILISTSVFNKVSLKDGVILCQYLLPLSLTFYLISFLLVVVYAWKSKTPIQGWRANPTEDDYEQSQCRRTNLTIPVYLFVWLVPIAFYAAYVRTPFITPADLTKITNSSGTAQKYCTSCILFLHVWRDSCSDAEKIHDSFINIFLLLVVIAVVLSCSVIYYKIGKWYEAHKMDIYPVEGDGRSGRRFRGMFATARNMVMVILFCWTPALVLILLSGQLYQTHITQQILFTVYVIQATSVSLQGFFNSMVYAWRRRNFMDAAFGEATPLVSHSVAFFDESLRSSL